MTHLPGDRYSVFTSHGGGTVPHGAFDRWSQARDKRNDLFRDDTTVRAAWIMRDNPGLDLRPEKMGSTLRRNKRTDGPKWIGKNNPR